MATAYKATAFYDAGETVYNFPFLYLRKEFVKARYDHEDGTITALAYNRDYSVNGQTLTLTAAGVAGDRLCIYRETPTDQLVRYADASVLKAYDMNLAEIQLLHLAEENTDYIILHSLSIDLADNAWQGFGHRIKNVGDPVEAQDAVTLHYLNEVDEARIHTMRQIQEATAALLAQTQTSEANAGAFAANARTSETNASASETNAKASETNAKVWAEGTDAEVSPLGGEHSSKGWASRAASSATNAALSYANAAASESAAAASAQTAAQRANDAAGSVAAAAGSASNASSSATAASASANTAAAKAAEAQTSATGAAASASSAAQSAQTAARYATSDYAQQAEAAADRAEAAASTGSGQSDNASGGITEAIASRLSKTVASLHEYTPLLSTDTKSWARTNPATNDAELVVITGGIAYIIPLTRANDVYATLEINAANMKYKKLVSDGATRTYARNPLKIDASITSLESFWTESTALQRIDVEIDKTGGYQPKQIKNCRKAMSFLRNLRYVSFPAGFFTEDGDYAEMFRDASALQTIHILSGYINGSYQSEDVMSLSPSMTAMFQGCACLRSVAFHSSLVLRDSPTINWTQMFYNCKELTKTYLYLNVSFTGVMTATRMYEGCCNLRVPIKMQAAEGGYIEDATSMFQGCTCLPAVAIDAEVVNGCEMFRDCVSLRGRQPEYEYEELTELIAPIGARTTNAQQMFMTCVSLHALTLPAVASIQIEAAGMFYGCLSLQEVHVSEETIWTVAEPSGMFQDCKSLRKAPPCTVKAPEGDWPENAENMFRNCTSLEDASAVTLPDNLCIAGMFCNCKSLAHLPVLPKLNHDLMILYALQETFRGCQSLPSVFPQIIDLSLLPADGTAYEALLYALGPDAAAYGYNDVADGLNTFTDSSVTDVTIKIRHELQSYITPTMLKKDGSLTIHFIDAD